jgi:hypothetical protein
LGQQATLHYSLKRALAGLAAEYTLMPNPQTVHVGYLSAALMPMLTINSGAIITIVIEP